MSALTDLNVEITDLDGLTLGRAFGDTIYIEQDAAGYGWFIDQTPADDAEFRMSSDEGMVAKRTSDAYGRMDLLSVVVHEFGHLFGEEHTEDGTGAMAETLTAGVRTLEHIGDSSHADHPAHGATQAVNGSENLGIDQANNQMYGKGEGSDRSDDGHDQDWNGRGHFSFHFIANNVGTLHSPNDSSDWDWSTDQQDETQSTSDTQLLSVTSAKLDGIHMASQNQDGPAIGMLFDEAGGGFVPVSDSGDAGSSTTLPDWMMVEEVQQNSDGAQMIHWG